MPHSLVKYILFKSYVRKSTWLGVNDSVCDCGHVRIHTAVLKHGSVTYVRLCTSWYRHHIPIMSVLLKEKQIILWFTIKTPYSQNTLRIELSSVRSQFTTVYLDSKDRVLTICFSLKQRDLSFWRGEK